MWGPPLRGIGRPVLQRCWTEAATHHPGRPELGASGQGPLSQRCPPVVLWGNGSEAYVIACLPARLGHMEIFLLDCQVPPQ